MKPLTGAILAGGAAKRFDGRPKGLELVGGRRILDRVATALRAATPELLIVSNDPGAEHWIDGVRAVPDIVSGRSSILGIHSALVYAGTDALVVAWDMPFVSSALLIELASRRADDLTAIVPHGQNGPEPCCALYMASALPYIEQLLRAGQHRLSAMLGALPRVADIPLESLGRFGDPALMFTNVNTVEELENARGRSGSPS